MDTFPLILNRATNILNPITDSAPANDIIKILNTCPIPSWKFQLLINTIKVTANNIISIAIIIKIIFFRFRMNPKIPIKNNNIKRFIFNIIVNSV